MEIVQQETRLSIEKLTKAHNNMVNKVSDLEFKLNTLVDFLASNAAHTNRMIEIIKE